MDKKVTMIKPNKEILFIELGGQCWFWTLRSLKNWSIINDGKFVFNHYVNLKEFVSSWKKEGFKVVEGSELLE